MPAVASCCVCFRLGVLTLFLSHHRKSFLSLVGFMLQKSSSLILPEMPERAAAINRLHAEVFGPGRFARTAFRVRESADADPRFCFIVMAQGRLVGSVRLTPVAIGGHAPGSFGRAFMLGPLCVAQELQGKGHGKALVRHALEAVQREDNLPVLLVGDPPYYRLLGFEPAPRGILLPGPVDYSRLLIAWPEAAGAGAVDRSLYRGALRGLAPLTIPHSGESTKE